MGVEDGGVFCSNRFRDALLHLQNLHARLNERSFETPDFIRDLRRRDAVPRDIIEVIAHDMNLSEGASRGDACSFKLNFLPSLVAHANCQSNGDVNSRKPCSTSCQLFSGRQPVPLRNQSSQPSLKRALINSSSSSIAWSASGPSQRMRSFDPWPAASIIKPIMLLPLTSSPSFDTHISDRGPSTFDPSPRLRSDAPCRDLAAPESSHAAPEAQEFRKIPDQVRSDLPPRHPASP